MALKLQEKKKIVLKIKKKIKKALSIVTANYKHITVNKLYELRKTIKKKNVVINIVKNTLLKIAIKKTKFSCLKKKIKGPTLIAFSFKNAGMAARIFKNFSKDNADFKIISAVFENKLLNKKDINLLAKMPTYKEAIIKLILILKEISIGKFLRLLSYIKNKKIKKDN